MKKSELKEAFSKEFEKIKVSNELKEKTLNSLNSTVNKTFRIPYLKNIAAIFVVTVLCLSIYFVSDPDIPFDTTPENETIGNVESGRLTKSSANFLASPSYDSSFGTIESLNASIEQKNAEIVTEEEFLDENPEAEKIEDGYIVYEENKENIYVFTDNVLETIITIE